MIFEKLGFFSVWIARTYMSIQLSCGKQLYFISFKNLLNSRFEDYQYFVPATTLFLRQLKIFFENLA